MVAAAGMVVCVMREVVCAMRDYVNSFTIQSNRAKSGLFSSILTAAGGRASDASGAAKADGHLAAVVDDDGNGAAAVGIGQHALKLRRVFLDVDVFERHVPPFMILPGGLRVGSGVLAEDVDHLLIVRLASHAHRINFGCTSEVHRKRCRSALVASDSGIDAPAS